MSMFSEFQADQAVAIRIETHEFNGWRYTYQETCRGVRVAVTDPRGAFKGYFPLPGRPNCILSPNA